MIERERGWLPGTVAGLPRAAQAQLMALQRVEADEARERAREAEQAARSRDRRRR